MEDLRDAIMNALELYAETCGEDGEDLIPVDWEYLESSGYLTGDKGLVVTFDVFKREIGEDDDPSQPIGQRRLILKMEEVPVTP
jgi:hypothetical protein